MRQPCALTVLPAVLLALALGGCAEDHAVLLPRGDAGEGRGDGRVGVDAREPSAGEPMIVYRFDEGAGERVLDSAGSGALVHLRIQDPTSVTWLADALRLDAPTVLASDLPARDLVEAVRESNAVTIETWLVPAQTVVDGTRRIVSLSVDHSRRNVTLAQGDLFSAPDVAAYALRVRTTETGDNGLPMLHSPDGSVEPRLVHLVAVHRADGDEALYLDGVAVATDTRAGDLSAWDPDYRVALGNEHGDDSGSRAWLGELHYVAIYARALTADEVRLRYEAGALR